MDDYLQNTVLPRIMSYRNVVYGVIDGRNNELAGMTPPLRSPGNGADARYAWAVAGFYGQLEAPGYQLDGNRLNDSRSVLPSTTPYVGDLYFNVPSSETPFFQVISHGNADGTAQLQFQKPKSGNTIPRRF